MTITSNTSTITVVTDDIPPGYTLDWEDQFNGALDTNRWVKNGNARIENGNLVLYGSGGGIRTKIRYFHCLVKIKAKLCNVESYRSQFWMSGISTGECMYEFNFEYGWCSGANHKMGGNEKYIYLSRACDPNRQDINPGCGQPGEGWWGEGGCTGSQTRKAFQCKYTDGNTKWGDGWHTYTLEWTPDYLKWYIDGIQRCTTIYGVRQNQGLDIKLAMWRGPGWPCNNTTTLDGLMQVDYIKVYKKMVD